MRVERRLKVAERDGAIEADDVRVGSDLGAEIHPARYRAKVVALERLQVPHRNPGRGGNLLNRQAPPLTRATQHVPESLSTCAAGQSRRRRAGITSVSDFTVGHRYALYRSKRTILAPAYHPGRT